MGDWADEKASELFREWQDEYGFDGRYDGIIVDLAAALRDAAAEARQHENEKCQELIGARVGPTQEARDA